MTNNKEKWFTQIKIKKDQSYILHMHSNHTKQTKKQMLPLFIAVFVTDFQLSCNKWLEVMYLTFFCAHVKMTAASSTHTVFTALLQHWKAFPNLSFRFWGITMWTNKQTVESTLRRNAVEKRFLEHPNRELGGPELR